MESKTCTKCHEIKTLENFRYRKDRDYILSYCKSCENTISNNYNKEHPTETKNRRKEYYQNNKQKEKENHQIYRENNKDKFIEKNRNYYLNNKKKINKRQNKNRKNKLLTDIAFKIGSAVSAHIRQNINKNKKSIKKYLPYTMQELKEHLEKQFEPWMTWDNWGRYTINSWNDNDSTTWKWNIDHIIPHSTFQYTSMEDNSFKECWTLSNLRPYSAKQNILDGVNKTRH